MTKESGFAPIEFAERLLAAAGMTRACLATENEAAEAGFGEYL